MYLFTAGLRMITYNNKFVHFSRIISAREKAKDLFCLRGKTPHVHHRWLRLHTDLLLLNVKEKREYRFLVFRMYHFFELGFAISKLASLPYLECKVLKKKNPTRIKLEIFRTRALITTSQRRRCRMISVKLNSS